MVTIPRVRTAAILAVFLSVMVADLPSAAAADQWIQVASPHFTLTSNAGKADTSRLAWQLEQFRNTILALMPWAKADLSKPLAVFVLKDEPSLKLVAPQYWEKGNVHPASVWVTNADATYLALRTDVQMSDNVHENPYATAYFSYFSLILDQSTSRRPPPWFIRGLSGVMSNTVIRENKIELGPPATWYLRRLQDGPRFKLTDLLAAKPDSPFLKGDSQYLFDAESWSLVHYLMFGENGARWPTLDKFSAMVANGTDPEVAFHETIGQPEDIETSFLAYVHRNIFSFRVVGIDATVKGEGFTVTPLSAADAAGRRALVLAAMSRPIEARVAVADARRTGGAADAEVAEALLLDREDKPQEALAAYARATDANTTDSYAYYREASLMWKRDADTDTLTKMATLLDKATSLNIRYADAYDFLASTEDELGTGAPAGLALRAVSLEPGEPHHRLTAARLLARAKRFDDALAQVQAAATLADSAENAKEAADLRTWIERQKAMAK